MKWLKAVITVITGTILGMYGGQKEKGARRFGIAGFSVAMDWKRGWPMLFLIPTLIMGYGEDSWLMDKIGNDTLVRLVYAFLLSLPFYFYSMKRGLWAWVLLAIAFQIRAGSLGYWEPFGDFLVEDLIRYGTLMILIAFNLFFDQKSKMA